jgi:hypothetical protein
LILSNGKGLPKRAGDFNARNLFLIYTFKEQFTRCGRRYAGGLLGLIFLEIPGTAQQNPKYQENYPRGSPDHWIILFYAAG